MTLLPRVRFSRTRGGAPVKRPALNIARLGLIDRFTRMIARDRRRAAKDSLGSQTIGSPPRGLDALSGYRRNANRGVGEGHDFARSISMRGRGGGARVLNRFDESRRAEEQQTPSSSAVAVSARYNELTSSFDETNRIKFRRGASLGSARENVLAARNVGPVAIAAATASRAPRTYNPLLEATPL